MTVMLYKSGGPHKLHGLSVDYVIVNEDDVEDHMNDGWCKTPADAHAAIAKPEDVNPKPKPRGRPRKVKDDDKTSDN